MPSHEAAASHGGPDGQLSPGAATSPHRRQLSLPGLWLLGVMFLPLPAAATIAVNLTASLAPEGQSGGDWFGSSVSIGDDFNDDGLADIVVGAPFYDPDGPSEGRAYLYFSGMPPNAAPDLIMTGSRNQPFGTAVALIGDFNADTYGDLAVGEPGSATPSRGYVYVYYGGPGADGVPDLTLSPTTAEAFGHSLAGGDVNSDGIADILVGDVFGGSSGEGMVHIYFGGASPDAVADLTLVGEGGAFGHSVAVVGDISGDSQPDLAVGARAANVGSLHAAGKAYVYLGGPGIDPAADFVINGTVAADNLGASLAGGADLNGDGQADLVVGAWQRSEASPFTVGPGQVRVYFGGTGFDTVADRVISGENFDDRFGGAVALVDDLTGDACAELLVGAHHFSDAAFVAGRVYLFYGGASADDTADMVFDGATGGSQFGASVSAGGDFNGDGLPDVAIGARGFGANRGKAYFYTTSTSVVCKSGVPTSSPVPSAGLVDAGLRASTPGTKHRTDPQPGAFSLYGCPGSQEGTFETSGGLPTRQGWLGVDLTEAGPDPVGDFSKVVLGFMDLDPCSENPTPQMSFIDIAGQPPENFPPGTPWAGSRSSWDYGIPGSWVTNTTGGFCGAGELHNEVWSPPINFDLPGTADDDACLTVLSFTVWCHLPLDSELSYVWHVRSSADGGQTWSPWRDQGELYFCDEPQYLTPELDITDLLEPDCTHLQLALGVRQLRSLGQGQAPPSPLFDNVCLYKLLSQAPAISIADADFFQDSFPQSGVPASAYSGGTGLFDELLSVRIDRAAALPGAVPLVAGDSMCVGVIPCGVDLEGPPVLRFRLFANPAFPAGGDRVDLRSLGYALVGTDSDGFAIYEGVLVGEQARLASGAPIEGRYCFDFPFDGAPRILPGDAAEPRGFFPGDWLHYYIEASDELGRTATSPADLAGYQQRRSQYDRRYQVRGLPSIDQSGSGPRVLFVNDAFGFGNDALWELAWHQNGMLEGVDYDEFDVRAPGQGVSNGIGSAGAHGANSQQLGAYEYLVYDAGGMDAYVISDGSGTFPHDRSNDAPLLAAWQALSGVRGAVVFGDNVASTSSAALRVAVLGLQVIGPDVGASGLVPTAPRVLPTEAGVLAGFTTEWVADGGCPGQNAFDELTPLGGSVATHRFLTASGIPYAGGAAGLLWDRVAAGDRRMTLTVPVGFQFISTRHNLVAQAEQRSSRASLLAEALSYFGLSIPGSGPPAGSPTVRDRLVLHANRPNPFNPSTVIELEVGRLLASARLLVFDASGRVVRTLIDGALPAGRQQVQWDGVDDQGRRVRSGVYFYRLEAEGFRETRKMVLLK